MARSSNVSLVSLETLTTSVPHSRAVRSKLEITGGASVQYCEIDVRDDILSVVVASGFFQQRVSMWNWCTGQELFHVSSRPIAQRRAIPS